MKELKKWLLQNYKIRFLNDQYLVEAMTHSSYSNENKRISKTYNERIEFLGDAVLELYISQWLFLHFPDMKEGNLSKLRAQIVCEESLSALAKETKLDQFVLLGKGEEKSGGRNRPALLCDLFEAFIGALYLDKGYEEAATFLEKVIIPKIKKEHYSIFDDYKTALQEKLQVNGDVKIEYVVEGTTGPSHDKLFHVLVIINGQVAGKGSGRSKKNAEQEAASIAINSLKV